MSPCPCPGVMHQLKVLETLKSLNDHPPAPIAIRHFPSILGAAMVFIHFWQGRREHLPRPTEWKSSNSRLKWQEKRLGNHLTNKHLKHVVKNEPSLPPHTQNNYTSTLKEIKRLFLKETGWAVVSYMSIGWIEKLECSKWGCGAFLI